MLLTGFRTIYRILRLLVRSGFINSYSARRVLFCVRYGSQRIHPSGDGRNCGTGERLRPLAGLDWVRKCIFLCQGAQGGRGRGTNTTTFQQHGDEEGDKGVWMSVWVDNVDEMHKRCVAAGLEITFPPTDMPWNVREVHIRSRVRA